MKTFDNATCPFCALTCDDLSVKSNNGKLIVDEDLPTFCRASYENASQISTTKPRYKGKEITQTEAVAEASKMLKQAKRPLFGGLITDIQTMRALVPLARQCNATLDHLDSDKTLRNLRIMHGFGIVGATLSEIHRRADLLIFVGSRLFDDYPRLLQRVYKNKTQKKSVLIGPWQRENIPDILKADCDIVNTPPEAFPDVIQKLGMYIDRQFEQHEQHSKAEPQNDKDDGTLYAKLAADIERAEYPAFVWSAKDMDYSHADLGILLLARVIKKINLRKRCVSLVLSGNRGAGNTQSVCLWQSGYPGCLSFNSEQAYYNPLHNRTPEILKNRRADLLVWIASIHPEPPPPSDLPTIVFAHPKIAEGLTNDLVVPCGVPGVDHTGYSYRTDGVIILPLRKLRDSALPALHEMLQDIQLQLGQQNDD